MSGRARSRSRPERPPLASEMRAAKTVVGAESETVGPRTPAMSDEADGGDGDDVEDSFDLDEDGEHAEGEDDLDLTAEMARLGLDEEGEAREGGGEDAERESFDLDDSRDASAVMEEEEAEARRRVDAEFEMGLRRAELKHVELELKLVASEEAVRAAREALAAAEAERERVQAEAHAAWEEVGAMERRIAEEGARRDHEDAAKHKAARQARAVVEADALRKRGNEAYRNGECAEAESAYKSAVDALESCQDRAGGALAPDSAHEPRGRTHGPGSHARGPHGVRARPGDQPGERARAEPRGELLREARNLSPARRTWTPS